ncbi:putative DCC family thiol-disulfide oxidoreductase YuxK [Gillisia mitskevichiae]|uniref:Putative DCC family thiol-disulfide oxidoreductase YuxK n=1 Tax=Gillisia mitskevichiae TaxID=270921 RepID=A0A495PPM0_9FLAO|nr:DCC1-like thiol-disulfide oxidoreductase family protein [Gillisia mitskevichiae]RKS50619.1 putative DCC family thiol-disulfide oxidoreductase YuxK [Gillisia mitskevichiae]
MFQEINKTAYPPTNSIFVWDGDCKFCKWWKNSWEHNLNGNVEFHTYQEVNHQFPDIPKKEFQKASRLIDINGNVYSGPDSAFRIQHYLGNPKWHSWYKKQRWFKLVSNNAYNHIAKNRSFYYKATLLLFGKDPTKPKIYWFYYILLLILIIISI